MSTTPERRPAGGRATSADGGDPLTDAGAGRAGLTAGDLEQRLRRLRLASALVLLSYVLGHFVNHALGNVSLAAMDAWLQGMLAVWRNPVAGVLLYASLLVHALLGLWSLYQRRHLRMAPWEATQLASGLLIPPLLIPHVVATRLAWELYGLDAGYPSVLNVIWVANPELGIRQLVLLAIVWLHASIGVHYWLRIRGWYPRLQPWLLGAALLVPVLALLGYVEAGREIALRARAEDWTQWLAQGYGAPLSEQQMTLLRVRDGAYWVMGAALGATLLARLLRRWRLGRRAQVRLGYPGGRSVKVLRGTSVLEASRMAGIAHVSVCGGRGRCSTCRVRVGAGSELLPPPSETERRVLQRVQAAPAVRLACQTRPTHDLEVVPLLQVSGDGNLDEARSRAYVQGIEREVAILFADLRGSTALIEEKLPYDVVYVLNRFFAATTAGMERAGGHFAQFAGDGMMGLFGIGDGPARGAGAALAAARHMHENLEQLNRDLAAELDRPLRMGIGIHVGSAIVGAMGNPRSPIVTAIGDAVNVAARLEGLCKRFDCEVIVSEQVAKLTGLDPRQFPIEEVRLRGRSEALRVHIVPDALHLPVGSPEVVRPAPLR